MSNPTNSFWKWFALLLVVLNFTLLIFLVIKPRPHGRTEHSGPGGHPPEGPARFIIEQLHLNKEQESAFEKLKIAHRDSIERLQKLGHELRSVFFEGLRSDSSSQINTLAEKIASNQKEIELVTYKHFEAVKKICTPEQKIIFNEIIQDVLQRMAPRGPRRESPPPDHQRP